MLRLSTRILNRFSAIQKIHARQIIDSRGNPTIEAQVTTSEGMFRAAVPSGASTGKYEAMELRDGDAHRYNGKGVLHAVENVNKIIAKQLIGKDASKQKELDTFMVQTLDGTKNEFGWSKSKLGANSILAVSLALARAGAKDHKVPLYKYLNTLTKSPLKNSKFVIPVPSFNVINGGKHAGNGLAFQEFMIMPTGAKSFSEAVRVGAEVYHALMKIIKKKYGLNATNVGDEGGFAPDVPDGDAALQLLHQAIKVSGHEKVVEYAMDSASSELFVEGTKKYDLNFKNPEKSKSVPHASSADLNKTFESYASKYPFALIEDPFDQDDWQGWVAMTAGLGKKTQIVGDDLLVTNLSRIQEAYAKKACNSLLLKVNQIGTVTQSIEAADKAKSYDWGIMVSHRSGETEDTFIADLVVAITAGQIKTGAPCRSQRLAKYNQLLRIEEELGSNAIYAGTNYRNPSKLVS